MSNPSDVRHLGVLLFDGAEPLDALGPAQVLWSLEVIRPFLPPFPEAVVHLVAEEQGPVRMGYDLVVEATTSYADCPPLDALIVPGGSGGEEDDGSARWGRRYYERHQPTLDFIRRQADVAPIVASVCTGAFLLAGAGLLAGKSATTHWTARQELVEKMAARGEEFDLEIARVVDEGPVVTAGGVSSGIDLALHVLDRRFGKQVRDSVALAIELETPGAA